MAEPFLPAPVMLVTAAFSRHAEVPAWACEQLEREYGPIARASEPFDFHQTRYYESTMGLNLRKQFFAFRRLVQANCLPAVKLRTNELERQLAASGAYPEARPLNLDPGLLSFGKFQLATTKDQAHRIYLRDGIFAEVTLRFHAGAFEPWPWTYADYREPGVRTFLKELRDLYRQLLAEAHAGSGAELAEE